MRDKAKFLSIAGLRLKIFNEIPSKKRYKKAFDKFLINLSIKAIDIVCQLI